MPYIAMTDELIRILKEERNKSKISGQMLAEAIDKSRAFISQVENGKVPFIELDVLQKILKAVTKLSDDDFNKYIEELLKRISAPMSSEEMKKEEWMHVFDYQIRKFEIPEKIISFINSKCSDLNITHEDLVREINKNKGLEFANTYESNKIKVIIKKDTFGWAIRFDLPKDYAKRICFRQEKRISYINILGIIYNIYLLEGKSEDDAKVEAEKYLASNDIITILQRDIKKNENLKNKVESGEEFEPEDLEVTEGDKEFRKVLKRTLFYFDLLNDEKPSEAHKYINRLNSNFDADWRLMFAIMNLSFDKFKPLPLSTKKDFFRELKGLVDKYVGKLNNYDTDVEYE